MAAQKVDWIALALETFAHMGKKELSVHEIAEHVEKSKYHLGFDKDTLVAKFSSALAANCKSKSARFKKAINAKTKRPKKGCYAIKQTKAITIKPIIIDPAQQASTQYTGKAGEYGLLSELLFYGYNASIMSVDDGIDLVASDKDLRYYHFQVKTTIAKDSRQDTFTFNLDREKFSRNSNAATYYIFVMRCFDNLRWYNDYAVLPSSIVDHAHFSNTEAANKVTIKIASKKYFINGIDITNYINNFKGIK